MSKREHELVPEHRIMSHNEANSLLDSLGVSTNNLPKILVSDPQVKKIGAKIGDIIEIEREDFGKSFKYYRFVVQG